MHEGFHARGIRSSGRLITPASALCCTSDLTVAEFKSLKGKMDASVSTAKTPQEYQGGTANYRTDLYDTGATVLTHKESIELLAALGSHFTPELKAATPAPSCRSRRSSAARPATPRP